MIQKNGQNSIMIDDVMDSLWTMKINGFHFSFFPLPSLLEDLAENEMGKASDRGRKEKRNPSTK